jgi:predicted small metal-binding protein
LHFADVHDVDIEVEMNISDEGCGCDTESETRGAESSAGEKEEFTEGEETGGIQLFECPMCREDIRGSSDDERSANLREHMVTTHKDEPFITQMLEEIGTR